MASKSTTSVGMLKAAECMENMQASVQQGVRDVDSALAMLNGPWSGEAAGMYQGAMQTWQEDCVKINKLLGDMVEVMHGNRQAIIKTEQDATGVANSLKSGLGLNI